MPPKKNQHQLAPLLPAKTPLRDVATKKIYLLGAQIATGGFGRIYSCYEEGSRKENLCCKVEPQGNGPLFTEVNVFQRILRNDLIEEYKKEKKIGWLGVPYVVSTGIFDHKDIKLRYLIIPKYASSLEDMRVKKKVFDVATCLKIVRPILDALQYIHSKDYVHADVKASNILLEDSANVSKAVLVDYGLARMAAQNVNKPDKKKAHNGTAIFTSLDAHRGLNPSFRGDIEILAYNVLYWLTGTLPWHHLEAKVEQVFTAKEDFYKDLDKNLKKELQDHPTTINWMKFLFEVSVKTPYKSEVDFGAIKKVIGRSSTPTASPVKKTTTARTSTKRNSADEEPLRAAVKKLKTTPTASRATKISLHPLFPLTMIADDEYLLPRPPTQAPKPLSEDFFDEDVEGRVFVNPGGTRVPLNAGNGAEIRAEPIAEKLIKENEKFIEKEVMKQAAVTNATTVMEPQYHDLIPLSFDEQELIRKAEQKRQTEREKAAEKVKSGRR